MSSRHADPAATSSGEQTPSTAAGGAGSNLQSAPCDLLRIPKSRRFTGIASYIANEGKDKVVHFSAEVNEVIDSGLVPRIIVITERALYKFPLSAVNQQQDDSTSNNSSNANIHIVVPSLSFEERRFPVNILAELVAVDGGDGDLQGHNIGGLDVQVFGFPTTHLNNSGDGTGSNSNNVVIQQGAAPRLLFCLNFGELTSRRQAFLLNMSMIRHDLPIMQKQRIRKLAAVQPQQQAQVREMLRAADQQQQQQAHDSPHQQLLRGQRGASPSSLQQRGASPTGGGGGGSNNWMSAETLKAKAAERRKQEAAKERVAAAQQKKKAAVVLTAETFARLSEPKAARSDSKMSNVSAGGGGDRSTSQVQRDQQQQQQFNKKMHSPSRFNQQRRDDIARREEELPIHLRPEFYEQIYNNNGNSNNGGDQQQQQQQRSDSRDNNPRLHAANFGVDDDDDIDRFFPEGKQKKGNNKNDDNDDAEHEAGALTVLQSDESRVIRPPRRELDEDTFEMLRSSIHNELLAEDADIGRTNGGIRKMRPLTPRHREPPRSPQLSPSSPHGNNNGNSPRSTSPSSAGHHHHHHQPKQQPYAGIRGRTVLQNASFDGRPVEILHNELSPDRQAERDEIREMLIAREEQSMLDAQFRELSPKKRLTTFEGTVPNAYEKSHPEKYAPRDPSDAELLGPSLFPLWRQWKFTGGLLQVLKDQKRNRSIAAASASARSTFADDEFDFGWTLFDSEDLINSLKSQEFALLGQVGTKSIERLKHMRMLVEREKRMYVNSVQISGLNATSRDALPLSSRLAMMASPLSDEETSAVRAAATATSPGSRSDNNLNNGSTRRNRSATTAAQPFRLSMSPSLERMVMRRLALDDGGDNNNPNDNNGGGASSPMIALHRSASASAGNHGGGGFGALSSSSPTAPMMMSGSGGGRVITSPKNPNKKIRIMDESDVGAAVARVKAQLQQRNQQMHELTKAEILRDIARLQQRDKHQ